MSPILHRVNENSDTFDVWDRNRSHSSICSAVRSQCSGTSSVFFHLGGPGIGISYDRWAIRWQLYPSVRWYIGPASSRHATVNSFTPILGTGPAIQYQHVLVLLPAYYLSSSNVWIVSAGVGLSFK